MYKISVDFLKWLPSRDREVTSNSAQLDTMTSSVIVGLGQEWDPSQFWFLKWDQLEISQENLKKSRQIKSLIGIMRFQTNLAVFRNTQKSTGLCDSDFCFDRNRSLILKILIFWDIFNLFWLFSDLWIWPLLRLCRSRRIRLSVSVLISDREYSWVRLSK